MVKNRYQTHHSLNVSHAPITTYADQKKVNMKKFSDAFVMSPEDINRAFSTIDKKVNNQLSNILGVNPMITQPSFSGQLPDNLELLSNHDIAQFMGLNNEWAAYLRDQHSELEVQMAIVKEKEAAIKSSLLRVMDKNLIPSDARYVDVIETKLYFDSLAKKVEIHLKRADNNYKVLSRIISLRQQDEEKSRRTNSVRSGGNGKYAFRNS